MPPLGIGLIGCGFIGRFHSAAIRDLGRRGLLDIRHAAVCDLDETRARSFAEITGAPLVTTDARELIASPEVNIVYVCVPTAGHKAVSPRGCGARQACLLRETPGRNASRRRGDACGRRKRGRRAGVGLILRHSPILTVLKSLTADPTIGRLMAIFFRDDQFFPIQGHYAERLAQRSRPRWRRYSPRALDPRRRCPPLVRRRSNRCSRHDPQLRRPRRRGGPCNRPPGIR